MLGYRCSQWQSDGYVQAATFPILCRDRAIMQSHGLGCD
jgi:hypothetical protein